MMIIIFSAFSTQRQVLQVYKKIYKNKLEK